MWQERREGGGISIEERGDSGPSPAGNRQGKSTGAKLLSGLKGGEGNGGKFNPDTVYGKKGGFWVRTSPSSLTPSPSVQPKRTVGNLNVGYFWPSRLIDQDWIVAA